MAAVRKQTPQWFQLYVHRDRALTCDLVQRAEAAGYAALCLTVDAAVLGRRERDRRCGVGAPAGDGTSRGALAGSNCAPDGSQLV